MKKLILIKLLLLAFSFSNAQFGSVIKTKSELFELLDSSQYHFAYACAEMCGLHLDSLEFVGEENYNKFSECHNEYSTVVVMIRNFLPSETMLYKDEGPMSYVKGFPGTKKPDKPCVMFFLMRFDTKIKIYMQYYF